MLQAGFGKQEITPAGTTSLAGYFTWLKQRRSSHIRDPLFVRAIALRDGDTTLILLAYDLLLITDSMQRDLCARLKGCGATVIVHATHTHSAPGGYWNTFTARLAMGAYKPGMMEFLCHAGEGAARQAMDALAPCHWSVRSGHLPELAKNRRDENGPVDDGLWALRFIRDAKEDKEGLLVGFSGHPVIVAEREPGAVSADFPGEVVRRIEEKVAFAAFVNGALGGVDVHFPDVPIPVEQNLQEQAEPIVTEALKVRRRPKRKKAGLRIAWREFALPPRAQVTPTFKDQPGWRILTKPLAALASTLFDRAEIRSYTLKGFALGDVLFIGTPADLGVSVSLAIQQYARDKGFAFPFVASQCDGYIGYLHRESDYERTPSKETRSMAIYENVMNIFGHAAGEELLTNACSLIDELVV